jgi:hypothetical protein
MTHTLVPDSGLLHPPVRFDPVRDALIAADDDGVFCPHNALPDEYAFERRCAKCRLLEGERRYWRGRAKSRIALIKGGRP